VAFYDPALFYKKGIMVMVYVDNILISRQEIHCLNESKILFPWEFHMTDLGQVKFYLNMQFN
jgi:hypothetical protein